MVDSKHLNEWWIGIAIYGLIGNAISIYVWHRIMKSKRIDSRATTIYFIALGLVDSGMILFFPLTNTIHVNDPVALQTYPYAALASYVAFPVFFLLFLAKMLLFVGVTATRFVKVHYPLKAQGWGSSKGAYIGISAILVASFIFTLPRFFTFHAVEKKGNYQLQKTMFGQSNLAQMYDHWANCIFIILVPMATIAFLNSGIMFFMLSLGNQQEVDEEESTNSEEYSVTQVWIFLGVAYTVFILFSLYNFILLLQYKQNALWETDISLAYAKFIVIMTSSINLLLSCFTGSKFWKELKQMLFFFVSHWYAPCAPIAGRMLEVLQNNSTFYGLKKVTLDTDPC